MMIDKALLVLMLAVACVYVSADDDEDCCSAEDRHELQHVWHDLWTSSFTDRRVSIARAVFEDLFKQHPEAKDLFKRVKIDEPESGEFRTHLVRVTNGLDLIVNLLDDTQVLGQQLAHLAHQHEARPGVRKAFFEAIGRSFERVLPQVTSCFNVEAWNRCFHRLAKVIAGKLPE